MTIQKNEDDVHHDWARCIGFLKGSCHWFYIEYLCYPWNASLRLEHEDHSKFSLSQILGIIMMTFDHPLGLGCYSEKTSSER